MAERRYPEPPKTGENVFKNPDDIRFVREIRAAAPTMPYVSPEDLKRSKENDEAFRKKTDQQVQHMLDISEKEMDEVEPRTSLRDNLSRIGNERHEAYLKMQRKGEYVEQTHLHAILTGCMVAVLKVSFPIPACIHTLDPMYPQHLSSSKGSYHQSYFFTKELALKRLELYCELHVAFTASIHLFWTSGGFEVTSHDGQIQPTWDCELTYYESATALHNRKKCTKVVVLQMISFMLWTDWRDLVGLDAPSRTLSEK